MAKTSKKKPTPTQHWCKGKDCLICLKDKLQTNPEAPVLAGDLLYFINLMEMQLDNIQGSVYDLDNRTPPAYDPQWE